MNDLPSKDEIRFGALCSRAPGADAVRVLEKTYAHNGDARQWASRPASAQPPGSPEHVAEILQSFVELGRRHLVVGFPSPYDPETMERLIPELQPLLARSEGEAVSAAAS